MLQASHSRMFVALSPCSGAQGALCPTNHGLQERGTHVPFLPAPTGEESSMHPKLSPNKSAASQGRQTHSLLFSSLFTVYFC